MCFVVRFVNLTDFNSFPILHAESNNYRYKICSKIYLASVVNKKR